MRRAVAAPETPLVTGAAAVLAVLAGMAVARGMALPLIGLVLAGCALVAGLLDWRWSLLALLVYMPLSGLVTLAMYPKTAPGSVAKDVLFVVPAYAGFAAHWLKSRRPLRIPGFPTVAVGALTALVLVEMVNPSVPTSLVAIIGAKTWLLYIPLALLGYELVSDRAQLDRMLLVFAGGAVIPCVIGVIEALLVYTGHSGAVYSLYGPAASSATQGFAEITVGSAQLHRIPSTFTASTQFYSFTAAMAAVSYAAWRGVLVRRGRGMMGLALLALSVLAATLSGTRSGILLVPGLVIVAVLLDTGAAGAARRVGASAATIGVALALASIVLGSSLRPLLLDVAQHGLDQLRMLFVSGLGQALHTTTFGLGTGVDTIASRYALPSAQLFQVIGGSWQESWWVKAVLELGVLGLVVTASLMASLVWRGVRTVRTISDPHLRPIAAAITAYLIWATVSAFKAQDIDLDPMDVYIWLLVGILLRLPTLAAQGAASDRPPG